MGTHVGNNGAPISISLLWIEVGGPTYPLSFRKRLTTSVLPILKRLPLTIPGLKIQPAGLNDHSNPVHMGFLGEGLKRQRVCQSVRDRI